MEVDKNISGAYLQEMVKKLKKNEGCTYKFIAEKSGINYGTFKCFMCRGGTAKLNKKHTERLIEFFKNRGYL